MKSVNTFIRQEIRALFELKKTERLWHIPLLAGLCVGIPSLAGLYFGRPDLGVMASSGGLVILYLQSTGLAHRMLTLMLASYGFVISYAIGLLFSFDPYISSLVLGIFSFGVHWVTRFFQLRPPGNFFFIMMATISSCMPFDLGQIPFRVGLLALSTISATILALFYSLYSVKRYPPQPKPAFSVDRDYSSLVESMIIGVFIGISLLVGHLLKLERPYWVPISCLAVMQGVNTELVWRRSFQRILGTSVGMGLAWILLRLHLNELGVALSVMVLQFIIELLITRHYALAVVFITPMTLILAENSGMTNMNPDALVATRFLDIFIGSIIGAIGGWFFYHQQLREKAARQIRKTKVAILRK